MSYRIAALYRFVFIKEPGRLRDELRERFSDEDLCGTLLIAAEGINGTLAGSETAIEELLALLAERTGLERREVKFADSAGKPFGRLKFKLKKEIITFRGVTVDPARPGTYVEPADWNELLEDPNVVVVDTRNRYETKEGVFAGAVDPQLDTFSDFVTWAREHLDPAQTPKVAMYCTGGIRCEKASAFLLQEGFGEVYHLRGGILKYLEEVAEADSKWQGECFVFDRREGVGHKDLRAADGSDAG